MVSSLTGAASRLKIYEGNTESMMPSEVNKYPPCRETHSSGQKKGTILTYQYLCMNIWKENWLKENFFQYLFSSLLLCDSEMSAFETTLCLHPDSVVFSLFVL